MRSALRNLMSRYSCGLGILAFCVLFVFALCFINETAPASAETAPGLVSQPDPAARARAVESYGKLPLSFEANAGQADQQVKFLSRGSGYTLFLTSNEAVLALRKAASGKQKTLIRNEVAAQRSSSNAAAFPGSLKPPTADPSSSQKADTALQPQVPTPSSESSTSAVLRLKLVGANPAAEISGLEQLPGTSNYFIGNDPKKWRTAVPNYAKVRYQDVYPGVDLVYYGNQRQLEYDFVVAPGANPHAIKLDFTGTVGKSAKGHHRTSFLRIDHNGDLVVRLNGSEVSFHKPTAYQLVSDSAKATSESVARDIVEAGYVLQSNDQVGIRLAPYDPTRALTIDPVLLQYSSFLGGSGDDEGLAIAVDSSRNAYVTGFTDSPNFPRVHQIPGACLPSCGTGNNEDVFVTKIDAAGSALVYSSYIGGSGGGVATGVAVDGSGNAYVTGWTDSSDFPIVHQISGACQGSCGTGNEDDVFVTKINAAGSALVYSSYIGGSDPDKAEAIAVDGSGNAYVTGPSDSPDFPIVNQIPGACMGCNPTNVNSVVFVTEINAAGSALVYSSFLGGSQGQVAWGIAVDSSGNAYVTGVTSSFDFPRVHQIPGACLGSCGNGNPFSGDVFVTKISAVPGSPLVYSSYIGGSGGEIAFGIAVDGFGNAYLTGITVSSDFPIVPVGGIPGACLGSCGTGSGDDVFVTKVSATPGSPLVYSSYIGGSGDEEGHGVAVDGLGNAYVTGFTQSSDFPIVHQIAGACQGSCGSGASEDVFVTKVSATPGSALVYSSYLGGSGNEEASGVAVDGCGNAYVTGVTASSDFPRVHQISSACLGSCGTGNNSDVFVTKILNVGPNVCP